MIFLMQKTVRILLMLSLFYRYIHVEVTSYCVYFATCRSSLLFKAWHIPYTCSKKFSLVQIFIIVALRRKFRIFNYAWLR